MVTRVSLPTPALRPAGWDGQARDLSQGLVDRFGRRGTDLRISLTDKCNLRCTYCMPADGLPWLNRADLLSASEIRRLVRIGVDVLGVRELRLTGGEPLVRKDLVEIISAIRHDHQHLPIAMTTNAIGLERRASQLREAGLDRVNISLDSVHRETFAKLTRRDHLAKVLQGVAAAQEAGLTPLKINAVLMRGLNDHEAPDLLQWALAHGYQLRFIEQMPLEAEQTWKREGMVTAAEVRELLSEHYLLVPADEERNGAPAERFDVWDRQNSSGGPLGTVGIIASATEPFCAACTRTRITAEGKVMSCLFSSEEHDLRDVLRDPSASDEDVASSWAQAMWAKPAAHGTDRAGFDRPEFARPSRSMSAIGG